MQRHPGKICSGRMCGTRTEAEPVVQGRPGPLALSGGRRAPPAALYQPPEPVTYQAVPHRHGGRRPAIHDFFDCDRQVVGGRPAPAMTIEHHPASQWFGRSVLSTNRGPAFVQRCHQSRHPFPIQQNAKARVRRANDDFVRSTQQWADRLIRDEHHRICAGHRGHVGCAVAAASQTSPMRIETVVIWSADSVHPCRVTIT